MNVVAIIVTCNPDLQQLARLCASLAGQVARVVVVDNSEADVLGGLSGEDLTLLRLGENTGVAHAQNVGIRAAMAAGAEAIVLFDQDSDPGAGYLSRLLHNLGPAEPWVVAPVCVDRWTRQELPSYRLGRWGWTRKVFSGARQEPYPVDLVIASGCAASAVVFSRVGLMDEEFFIDFVDFEWCLRCRNGHVPIRVVPAAVMEHCIGERVDGERWYRGSVHSPARSYYKIRNCFLLFRKPTVPPLFALKATIQALAHGAISLLFVKRRFSYLKTMALGAWHGLCGRVGRSPILTIV